MNSESLPTFDYRVNPSYTYKIPTVAKLHLQRVVPRGDGPTSNPITFDN